MPKKKDPNAPVRPRGRPKGYSPKTGKIELNDSNTTVLEHFEGNDYVVAERLTPEVIKKARKPRYNNGAIKSRAGMAEKMWQPGQSGNPSGRPKSQLEMIHKAQAHSPQAMERILRVLYDDTASNKDVLVAAKELLDRAFGKPKQEIEEKSDQTIRIIMDEATKRLSR